MKISFKSLLAILFALLFASSTDEIFAQEIRPLDRRLNRGVNSNNAAGQTIQSDRDGRPVANRNASDSFQRRDINADSITIYYRYFDSTRIRFLDSSILDLNNRFPLPAHYVHLGNLGTAARSLIFQPNLRTGPDPGFHAYDVYRFNFNDTRFYQTTRPFTQLGYLLGSRSEQIVNLLHTQNIKPTFNMAFQYRFVNSPGEFKNQNTSHNNYRINATYQSDNKRYTAYAIFLRNKLRASEHGGIRNDSDLNKSGLNDPFDVATRLAGTGDPGRNFFNTRVNTGNLYDENSFLFRHQYDLGQKDSVIVNDSTTYKLFYPRIRFQHTFIYSKQSFQFQDLRGDSTDYRNFFGYPLKKNADTLLFLDQWRFITNDFSIISFPVKNNPNQFLKVGAAIQNFTGTYLNANRNLYNVILNGEYRNRTKNQKWDLEAGGQFYAVGNNAGDYAAQVSLQRLISKKLGTIEVGFQNVNRTPSFIFSGETSYPVKSVPSLNKENTTRLFAIIDNPDRGFRLFGDYYLISNYTYFDSFFNAQQEGTLFNILHVGAEKKFKLNKRWNLYSEIHLQQAMGNPPINLPLIYTRHRIAYEANLYRNLFLATGLELRYHTPYKADNYSPFVGQFFFQDVNTISNRPDINAFFNFRIKSFSAFLRLENLNTLNKDNNGVGFSKRNYTAVHYPTQSMWFRLGIWWNFVN